MRPSSILCAKTRLTTFANDQTVSDGDTLEGTRLSSSQTEIEDVGEGQDDGGRADS
jgi:hypothetical protein